MADWFSGDVTANGIRMHYYRTGGDKPQLVLSHGATDDGLCWTRVVRALENDYDVIMPDARGHGLSEAPATGYTNADHAADLVDLIRALGLSRPALGGHSMGAATTLRVVADQPDLASCAMLEDPPVWIAAPPMRPRNAMQQIVQDARVNDIETTIARGREASPAWSDEEWQPWAGAKQHVSDEFLNAMTGGAIIPQDWREQLARVRVPLLLITSDPERGAIVTPEAAAEAQRILPDVQVVRLQGAGHNIRREQFDGFVATVRQFLAQHARALRVA